MHSSKASLIGWTVFSGTHLAMSATREKWIDFFTSFTKNEDKQKQRKDAEGMYLGVYSVVALASFLPMTYIYWKRGVRTGFPVLPQNSTPLNAIGITCNSIGAFLLSQKSHSVTEADSHKKSATEMQEYQQVQGIQKITRHPMFAAFCMFGIGQALRYGTTTDLCYWLGYPIFYIIGGMHQDQRFKKILGEDFYSHSSLMPFFATLQGKNELHLSDFDFQRAVYAVAIMVALGGIKYLRKRP